MTKVIWSRKLFFKVLVNFFIIGAQRCGTTYLYRLLDQHPNISMSRPMRPEPKFFHDDNKYHKGINWYHNSFFDTDSTNQIFGEKSTSYIESGLVAKRIFDYNPHAKIIVMLRDPVQRALSNYQFSYENGIEKLDLSTAFLEEKQRVIGSDVKKTISVSPYSYVERGFYINYLEMYLRYFPKSQLKIVQTESLIENPNSIEDIYDFIGVDEFAPKSPGAVNASVKRKVIINNDAKELLEKCYIESNQRLEDTFEVDLTLWPCKAY